MRLCSTTFTSSGSWVCPAGVTQIIVHGQGGGASGIAGSNGSASNGGSAGAGGFSTYLVPVLLTVVPNTTYTITIGAGGTSASSFGVSNPGGHTSFGVLATWYGAGPSGSSASLSGSLYTNGPTSSAITGVSNNIYPIQGDTRGNSLSPNTGNAISYGSYAAKGSVNGASNGGGGGGGGNSSDAGVGGTGGNGGTPGVAGSIGGTPPSTSYGAGGGGGGGGGSSSAAKGNGGPGQSGRLIVTWAE